MYGGIYIDCTDVKSNVNCPLINTDIFGDREGPHVLYVDHCSQIANPSTSSLADFSKKALVKGAGNDALICSQNNPLLQLISNQCFKNYDLAEAKLETRIKLAHTSRNMRNVTIERTGPAVISQLFEEHIHERTDKTLIIKLNEQESKSEILIKPIRNPERSLVQSSEENTLYWLIKKITKFENDDDIIDRIQKTIIFESIHFKIIRLDDHIDDYIATVEEYEIDLENKEEVVANLLIKFNLDKYGLNDETIYVQLTGKYKSTLELIQSSSCQSILGLSDEQKISAIKYQSNYFILENDFNNGVVNLIRRRLLISEIDKYIDKHKDKFNTQLEQIVTIRGLLLNRNHFPSLENLSLLANTIGLTQEEQYIL